MSDPIMRKLNEMQARCDAATDGPWEAEGSQVWRINSLVTAVRDHSASERRPDAEFIAASRTDMPRLIAALRAVLELHQPVPYAQGPDYCDECEHPAPCPTVKAIAEALGVDDA